MSGFSHLRSDRGVLAPPIAATVFEGRVARVHHEGDALIYSSGPEHRDADEVANIVKQLPGIKVYLGHPDTYPASESGQKCIGSVESGRLDEDTAVARIIITDQEALEAIEDGTKELSLGYSAKLVDGYQRDIVLDHLAVVDRARCNSTCSLRVDMLSPMTAPTETPEPEKCPCGGDKSKPEECTCKKADSVPVPCTCKNHAMPHNNGESMSDTNTTLAAEAEALKVKLEEAHKALTALEIEATNARKDADKAKADLEAAKAEASAAKADSEAALAKAKTDAEDAMKSEIEARVEKRVALITEAKGYLGETDINKLSDRDIKVAVIKHVDGDDVPADKSMDYVDGVYAGALKRGNKAETSRADVRVTLNKLREDGAPKSAAELEKAAKENMKRASATAWATAK